MWPMYLMVYTYMSGAHSKEKIVSRHDSDNPQSLSNPTQQDTDSGAVECPVTKSYPARRRHWRCGIPGREVNDIMDFRNIPSSSVHDAPNVTPVDPALNEPAFQRPPTTRSDLVLYEPTFNEPASNEPAFDASGLQCLSPTLIDPTLIKPAFQRPLTTRSDLVLYEHAFNEPAFNPTTLRAN
ncbi:hypothetical protein NA57DRAFT_61006 [Rhizodiscina lignyota]|uniref:Uncharacterized protein n=1 Tax=Rhizodiscina lignyota TaxID=1504668 RepID=A0A9P4I2H8_9PEZI|nr:hypothetical protein NA57DRAFT_61006 [Rhizodiscina lignyota]